MLLFLRLCGWCMTCGNPTSGCSSERPRGLRCVCGGHTGHSQACPSLLGPGRCSSRTYSVHRAPAASPCYLLPSFPCLPRLPLCLTGLCSFHPPNFSLPFLSEGSDVLRLSPSVLPFTAAPQTFSLCDVLVCLCVPLCLGDVRVCVYMCLCVVVSIRVCLCVCRGYMSVCVCVCVWW